MKVEEIRDLSLDQLDDELIKLKKEQFNLRFRALQVSWRTPRASARFGATLRASRQSDARSVPPNARLSRRNKAERGLRAMPKRILQGTVVSAKNDKTVVVRVERRFTHPLLKKVVRRSKKFHAHDESNALTEGDMVRIQECAPVSKKKKWTVLNGDQPAS